MRASHWLAVCGCALGVVSDLMQQDWLDVGWPVAAALWVWIAAREVTA
jgi:hypothetical protein